MSKMQKDWMCLLHLLPLDIFVSVKNFHGHKQVQAPYPRTMNNTIIWQSPKNHCPWLDICSRWGPLWSFGCRWRSPWRELCTQAAGHLPKPLSDQIKQQSWTGGGGFGCLHWDCWKSARLYGWARLLLAGIVAEARHILPTQHTCILGNCLHFLFIAVYCLTVL